LSPAQLGSGIRFYNDFERLGKSELSVNCSGCLSRKIKIEGGKSILFRAVMWVDHNWNKEIVSPGQLLRHSSYRDSHISLLEPVIQALTVSSQQCKTALRMSERNRTVENFTRNDVRDFLVIGEKHYQSPKIVFDIID
jgi:hypothetical protein